MLRVVHYREVFSVRSETFLYDLLGDLERSGRVDGIVVCHRRRLARARPFAKVRVVREGLADRLWTRLRGERPGPAVLSNPLGTRRAIESLVPDVVHAHMGTSGARLARLAGELPLVVSFHGSDVTSRPRSDARYGLALEQLRSTPVWCTAPSRWLADRLEALGFARERIVVVPNAVHPRFAEAAAPGPIVPRDPLRLIHVGRFVDCKGQVDLLHALADLQRTAPRTTLTLAGYGPLLTDVRRRAHALGLGSSVSFAGFVAHERLPALLREHHVYVQPSREGADGQAESFGIAAAEALAAGLPVVVTDSGGLTAAIGAADGWRRVVVRAGDPVAISGAVHALPREAPPATLLRAIDEHLTGLSPIARVDAILGVYACAIGARADHQRSASQTNA